MWIEFLEYMGENSDLLLKLTLQHLSLSIFSALAAVVVGVPAGVLIARFRKLSPIVLGFVSVVYTVPSLAMFGLLLPFLGTGSIPALTALFLYSLLAIVRNTYAGIINVDPGITEAARGMGMRNSQILLKIEFPLALPVILAGVRTATVINIGITTVAAYIGAGGLGVLVFRGIYTVETKVMLAGALPIFLMAIGLDLVWRKVEQIAKPW
jgi:osmoprotectant transport system permease protein